MTKTTIEDPEQKPEGHAQTTRHSTKRSRYPQAESNRTRQTEESFELKEIGAATVFRQLHREAEARAEEMKSKQALSSRLLPTLF